MCVPEVRPGCMFLRSCPSCFLRQGSPWPELTDLVGCPSSRDRPVSDPCPQHLTDRRAPPCSASCAGSRDWTQVLMLEWHAFKDGVIAQPLGSAFPSFSSGKTYGHSDLCTMENKTKNLFGFWPEPHGKLINVNCNFLKKIGTNTRHALKGTLKNMYKPNLNTVA